MNQPTKRDYEAGWQSAVDLAEWLRNGGQLPVLQTSLVLGPGEALHCAVPAEVAMFTGAEVGYSSGAFIAGRTWKGMAVTAGASWLMNQRAKNRAAAEAAPQWRSMGVGQVQLTTRRIVFPSEGQMIPLFIPDNIVAFEPDFGQYMSVLHSYDNPPVGFRGPLVPYLSVLLFLLLHRTVPQFYAPPGQPEIGSGPTPQ